MAGMEELLTLLFNALLLVFVVKLLLALFHTKIIVILLYILVLLFAMLLSGRFPDCLRLLDYWIGLDLKGAGNEEKMRSKKRKGNAAARERKGKALPLPSQRNQAPFWKGGGDLSLHSTAQPPCNCRNTEGDPPLHSLFSPPISTP
ncbi:hypothetical protein Zm00014a_003511 [Zea mays]|uniref:Uncharacterized protein n=1 Tax=Zea mays TaxID=4577 RepID=A0A317YFB6_MAIZE|nr:hypothetical protein Zm00014a_003511 [Zea mays]